MIAEESGIGRDLKINVDDEERVRRLHGILTANREMQKKKASDSEDSQPRLNRGM